VFNIFSSDPADIKATELPMLAASADGAQPRNPTSSQLGGLPWWPAGKPFPTDAAGRPLMLLAQINMAELPLLDPLPRTGLLQLFIGRDDTYGCNFCDPALRDDFACVFHEDTTAPATPIDPAFNEAEDMSPLYEPLKPIALTFAPDRMPVDPSDYRMERLLPKIHANEKKLEAYHNSRETPPIRIGGYPTFTQEDPRVRTEPGALGDFNLLTVDTTDGVMWGDSGVAQFFIHEDNLRRRDFSRVVYNWDCC
jgi:uncharacterized protein YwqG